MLKDMLYEMLMKATKFVLGVDALEDLFDISRYRLGRVFIKISNVTEKILNKCLWLGWHLFLISSTCGLYLVWIVIKRAWKKRRSKRKERRARRKRA